MSQAGPRVSVFQRIRSACALVAERAQHVRIDPERLPAVVTALSRGPGPPAGADPAHHQRGTPEATLAFVLTLDAINFGSGWFPHLKKRAGLSGYRTLARSLAEHFDSQGPWSPHRLRDLTPSELARALQQDPGVPEVAELLALYARALRDLGTFLAEQHGARFAGPVEAARESAARLVEILAQMPFYRDVARLDGREIPFYKRAQITATDLHAAFGGRGWGCFADIDELTLFADNLVPHVLRLEGVLAYDPILARRIEAGTLIPAGSREEIEIRACAVHAVGRMVEVARGAGTPLTARRLDELLWWRGQGPEFKAIPRHRTRSVFY